MGSQQPSSWFQNSAEARQCVTGSDSPKGGPEKPLCNAVEVQQHPGFGRGKLQECNECSCLKRGYMRLQWQNWKGKATRGGAQTSQLEPQVQDMKFVGPLFVGLS